MPRSIWKGAISFGLITIPVKVYGATEEKDISFRQVHPADGGRIKYKRVCEKCGQEVPYAEIGKGYEADDGRIAVLEKSDFDDLPLASSRAVEVVQFVDATAIDPIWFDRAYVLEPEAAGAKPYVLLRDALQSTGKAGVVKVALRQREAIALVRPHGEALVMQTMLWPDEVRELDFAAPAGEVTASAAEVKMAESFITELTSDFDPSQFTDRYREALEKVVQAKLEGTEVVDPDTGEVKQGEVVDLVAALKASVAAAKAKREAAAKQAG